MTSSYVADGQRRTGSSPQPPIRPVVADADTGFLHVLTRHPDSPAWQYRVLASQSGWTSWSPCA